MTKNDYVDSTVSALEFAAEAIIDAHFLLKANESQGTLASEEEE
jgi:hypothetical protein